MSQTLIDTKYPEHSNNMPGFSNRISSPAREFAKLNSVTSYLAAIDFEGPSPWGKAREGRGVQI